MEGKKLSVIGFRVLASVQTFSWIGDSAEYEVCRPLPSPNMLFYFYIKAKNIKIFI